MSGIGGIYYLDGRPVEDEMLGRMVDALAHRGPDGARVWRQRSVGLGHRMLRTTPESLFETLPLVDQTGALVITADARLDNREELIAALRLYDRPAEKITDSQLILGAYGRWGEQCPEKLLGDFAFAIWDGRQQRLFCVRDYFGVKPFYYYYRAGHMFAFASEIKGLLCLPDVPHRLNEVRVADYLANLFDDKSSTFYQEIFLLPPAHVLTVSQARIRIQPYWSLDSSRELRLRSDEEYAEAFRELFTEAVRCRLRSAFPVGATLSGGLDSSSVTCVARELIAKETGAPLPTFSLLFENMPQCDERSFIDSVVAQGGLIPHDFPADRFGPFCDWERVYWHLDEPFSAPNTFMFWLCCRAAREGGIRVLLDGLDGDNIVSHGLSYLAELARGGQWAAFVANAELLVKHCLLSSSHLTGSLRQLFRLFGCPYLDELARKGRWIKFGQEVLALQKHFPISSKELVLQHGVKPLVPEFMRQIRRALCGHNAFKAGSPPPFNREFVHLISRNFARRIGLKKRMRSLDGWQSAPPQSAREDHWRILTSGIPPKILEIAHRVAPAFHIEPRHPFMDKRVAEFCLALPPEQKLHQGWTRMILRRAMSHVLPEQVQWRGSKANLAPAFNNGLLTVNRDILDDTIDNGLVSIKEYVDINKLRHYYDQITSSERFSHNILPVWKSVDIALWLRYTGIQTPGL